MKVLSPEQFRKTISGYVSAPVFEEVLSYSLEQSHIRAMIVFGSFAYGTPHRQSDLDVALFYNSEVDNRSVRQEVTGRLKGLQLKKKLSLFAYSTETFAKLYHWENSIAHGIMAGILIYCPKEEADFLNWLTALRTEVPLNIRRYE